MRKQQYLVLLNSFTLVIMLFANYGFSTGLLSGYTVGEVSQLHDTLITPATYAFAIWSIIFIGCIAFTVFQFVLLKRKDPGNHILKTGVWFALGNIANTLWLAAWTSNLTGVSVLIILFLPFHIGYTYCSFAVRVR